MKKKDILNLITAQRTIAKHQNLLSTIQDNIFHSKYYEPEKFWFPNIPELKDYFAILKNELMDAKNETDAALKTIKDTPCTHEVRLNYHSLFSSTNECILCGHHASSDNCINFQESNYRNKHTVTFPSKYQSDDDGPYEIKDGLTNQELYTIIMKILENYTLEDEVDLVSEFSKLSLKEMTLNQEKRKQENYILIIGGTNREYIKENKDLYLSQIRKLNSKPFITYFNGLLNTKLAIIEQSDLLNDQEIETLEKDHRKVFFQSYSTLDELKSALYQVENIPFKLIIDLTEHYDYQIQNSSITVINHNLNLEEQFPESHIVKVHSLNQDKKAIETILKEANPNEIYQSKGTNPEYYYLDQEKVKKNTSEETCHHIKRLLRK